MAGGSRRRLRAVRWIAGADATGGARPARARRRSDGRREDWRRSVYAPAVLLGQRCVITVPFRLPRRDRDLFGELVRQVPTAVVDLGFGAGALAELLGDALGAHRAPVMHPAGPGGPGPQGAALAVADGRRLDRVPPAFAGDERPPPGSGVPLPYTPRRSRRPDSRRASQHLGELHGELAQVLPRQAAEGGTGHGRAGLTCHHTRLDSCGLRHVPTCDQDRSRAQSVRRRSQ